MLDPAPVAGTTAWCTLRSPYFPILLNEALFYQARFLRGRSKQSALLKMREIEASSDTGYALFSLLFGSGRSSKSLKNCIFFFLEYPLLSYL